MPELIYADGFDHYNDQTDLATVYSGVGLYNGFVAGRVNGKALSCRNGTLTLNIAPQNNISMGLAIYPVAEYIYPITFNDTASGDQLVSFTIDYTNQLLTVALASGSYVFNIPIIPFNNWSQIVYNIVIGASGSFYAKLNNNVIASMSGVDTRAGGGSVTSMNQVNINDLVNLGAIDDFYLSSGGDFGDLRFQTDFATNNVSAEWTPLSGTNVSQIQEQAMDFDTTYNYSSTVGNIDLFSGPTLDVASAQIIGVYIIAAVRKDDAGVSSVCNQITSSGTVSNGATINQSTSYEYQSDLYLTDPATGLAWTVGAVGNLNWGYKKVS